MKVSLHLHVAEEEPLFHSALQHPGTKTGARDPITRERQSDNICAHTQNKIQSHPSLPTIVVFGNYIQEHQHIKMKLQ